jgi:bifunctional UDP-N-acetylglucosamine pyrophosphorylase/glucosamine-1-phosphate N-acetyltransferase
MKAVLPVAGNGTRMAPIGVTTPKCLIPILNKPLLIWSLESLVQNDIEEVILVVSAGELGKKITDFIENELKNFESVNAIKISIAYQEQQLGTAHVLQTTKEFFSDDETFLFLNGDDIYSPQTVKQALDAEGLAVVAQEVTDPEKWGIFQTDEKGNLKQVIEKPEENVGNLASIGIAKLHSRVFSLFDQLKVTKRGEFEITDSLQLLANESPIKVLKNEGYWIPIGYPWHIIDATEILSKEISENIEGTIEENVIITGTVVLPKSSKILAGTRIEGTAIIGENVVIGPQANLRENVVIGDNSKIGFCVEVKNTVIGKNSSVSHLNYVGDSIIGDNVNIAGGTVIANFRHDQKTVSTPVKGEMVDTNRKKFGTVLGDGVKLGINTSIYPGRKIWPGVKTLPGQIVDKDLV